MSKLRITGGPPLRGTVRAVGNKNAVLPMMAAALLTDEPVTLENVPDIRDVHTMREILDVLGVATAWDREAHRLQIHARTVTSGRIPPELCTRIRASILLVAPLLQRLGQMQISPPGGDVIGSRRLDTHFYGLEKLGATIDVSRTFSFSRSGRLKGTDIFLAEASVTATEQILMAAVLAEGTSVIRNAACEPHVGDLARMLNGMGARIEGIDSNRLTVTGVDCLGGTTQTVGSDYTEAGSFLALAAATKGDVTVTGVQPTHYRLIRRMFARLGVELQFVGADAVRVCVDGPLRVPRRAGGGMVTIDDGIWPQFPSDLMSVLLLLATQVEGTVLFFEKLYESRMYFVDRLISMGADAVICDPHRVVVVGPSPLIGIELTSPDIRAGMALVGAALCAQGTSTIHNIHLVDRGYEDIDGRLRALGADVDRIR